MASAAFVTHGSESPGGSGRRKPGARVLEVGFAALLMGAVLALGSTPDWATAALEIGAAALVLLWVLTRVVAGDELYLHWSPLYPFVIAFAALIGCQLLFRLSAYPFVTRVEALRYVAYALLFFLAQQLLTRTSSVRRFFLAMAWFGFLVAVEAIAQDFTSHGVIYWHWPKPYSGSVYGPYVDHSHYAGLMEMLWPIPAVLSLHERGPKAGLYAFFAMLMAASIVFSRSRGGAVALLIQVVFLVLLSAKRRRGFALQFAMALVIGGAFFFWARPEGTLERLSTLTAAHDAALNGHRLDILRDSLRMFRERPVAGWGLETFPVVYPKFRSFTSTYFINEAHNDYAQVLVGTGLIGFALVLGFIVSLYRAGFRRMDVDSFRRDATLIALVGCTGILVHSATDFNLHIPANAALFYVYCSIATRPMGFPEYGEPIPPDEPIPPPVELLPPEADDEPAVE